MKKYIGDGILKGGITVQSSKPIDDRLVVNDINEEGTYIGVPAEMIKGRQE